MRPGMHGQFVNAWVVQLILHAIRRRSLFILIIIMFSNLFYLLVASISFLCISLCKDQLSSLKGVIDVADGILVYANYYPFPHHKLNSTPIESHTVYGERDCISACAESSQCRSLNFRPVPDANGKYLCQLLDTDKFNSSESFHGSLDFHHHSFTVRVFN